MRFYLDEDVDAASVRRAILVAGREVWRVIEAGRAGDSDENQLAYAIAEGAVVVTHDSVLSPGTGTCPSGESFG